MASCQSDLTLLALPIITLTGVSTAAIRRSSISRNKFLPGTHSTSPGWSVANVDQCQGTLTSSFRYRWQSQAKNLSVEQCVCTKNIYIFLPEDNRNGLNVHTCMPKLSVKLII